LTRLKIIDGSDSRAVKRLAAGSVRHDAALERRVRRIIDAVRSGGDAALKAFARRFDDFDGPLVVSRDELIDGASRVAPDVRRAIKDAARNIARVAARQLPRRTLINVVPGVTVEQRVEPMTRVGCYVPAGRFPLPSSLLMTVVPARVAGVREIAVACPRPEPAVMAAAVEAGATSMLRVGGAHAIAALAYGTQTIAAVQKIVGPGNRYVATAKAIVASAGACAIDFFAGPTEIVVVAATGNPAWVAADLVAQAEHDPDARAILITWRRAFADRVASAIDRCVVDGSIAARALRGHGAIVLVENADRAMALANRLAPEHLVVEREALARRPLVAGAVFVGPYTAQAAGDYATGSNHVLPTSGAARIRGGLSASDFVRVMSVQRVTRAGLGRLAPAIVTLARAEGLRAHAESIEVRLR
jgi:histidinol dehydrogenase